MAVRLARCVLMTSALLLMHPLRALAMPNFAQAYGLDCKACHTQVPALNAYGRYIQRTGYGAMDPSVVNKALPIWVGTQLNYDSQNQAAHNPNAATANLEPQNVIGNVAVHVDGLSNKFSFHVQQWLVSNNLVAGYSAPKGTTASDLDTAWVSYNGLLKDQGHLFAGKMPMPGPTYWGFWMDGGGNTPFILPEITVGQHAYTLDANAWGSKFNYVGKNWFAEAGYFSSTGPIGTAFNLPNFPAGNGTGEGQRLQYQVGYATPRSPLTLAVYGAFGSSPVQVVNGNGVTDSSGSLLLNNVNDSYNALGLSLQYDQRTQWQPGVLLSYQVTHDSAPGFNPNTMDANGNPTANYGPARSRGYIFEPYWSPFKKWEATVSFRREMTDNGLGTISQETLADFNFRIYRYLHAGVEWYVAPGGSYGFVPQTTIPSWRYNIWWTTPIAPVQEKPY
jgi:hypothetical protein